MSTEASTALEANKALVRRLYEEVFNGRRLEVVDELAAEDYEEHDPLPGQGGGREGLKQRVTMLVEGLSPRFTLHDVIAEADRVVVRWTNNATHSGTFLGVPPTGHTCSVAGIDIYRLDGNRIAEHWHVVDQLSMLQQLGLLPPA